MKNAALVMARLVNPTNAAFAQAAASPNLLFEGVTGPEGGVGVDVVALPRE